MVLGPYTIRMLLLIAALTSLIDAYPLEPTPYDDAGCQGARWNCPCAGRFRVAKRDFSAVHEAVKQTRDQTDNLLRNLGQRFGNDRHVEDLKGCLEEQQGTCMGTYLDPSCNLTGLPRCRGAECQMLGIPVLDRLRLRRGAHRLDTVREKMDQLLRVPLAYLAVYVEQAKHDEANRGLHAHDDTIREIEDTGIYRILCHLHRDYAVNQIPWEPTVPPKHTVLSHSCRKFTDRAPSDNRNYMVFHTLSKLLHSVAGELDTELGRASAKKRSRKRTWSPMSFDFSIRPSRSNDFH